MPKEYNAYGFSPDAAVIGENYLCAALIQESTRANGKCLLTRTAAEQLVRAFHERPHDEASIMKNHLETANRFRRERGHAGGVVVIFNGEVSGWMNELRDPQHWAPGCIAIDADGNAWLATGGNDYDGAARWTPTRQSA
jgi:hypothetical protein